MNFEAPYWGDGVGGMLTAAWPHTDPHLVGPTLISYSVYRYMVRSGIQCVMITWLYMYHHSLSGNHTQLYQKHSQIRVSMFSTWTYIWTGLGHWPRNEHSCWSSSSSIPQLLLEVEFRQKIIVYAGVCAWHIQCWSSRETSFKDLKLCSLYYLGASLVELQVNEQSRSELSWN